MDVAFAGLNFADIAARVGLYPDAPPPPSVLGYEVSGKVSAIGEGVSGLEVGQRVLAIPHFGGQASQVVVPADQVTVLPDSVSLEAAAALPVNYLTAFHMLHHVGRVRAGDRVLVHMAAGGVGLAVLQLLREVGGVTIFGTASAAKHALLKSAGVHHPIDYREKDYAGEVKRLTGGEGVHLVLDPLGGPDWAKGYELLAPTGHLIAFGWSNMVAGERRNVLRVGAQFARMPRYSPFKLMGDNKSVTGVNMGHLWNQKGLLRGHLEALLGMLERGVISPSVDKAFPAEQAADAHRYIQARRNVGKVLLAF